MGPRLVIVSRALGEELLSPLGAEQAREKVVQDDPLVVPAHRAPRALEQIGRRHILPAKTVDDGVVEAAEGEVELSHHDVRVVSRVTDDGGALRVSLNVVEAAGVVPTEEELGRIVDIEEVRVTRRSRTVEELEIDLLPARVSQRRYVGVVNQGRAIGGDVVGDELPEEGPARRLAGVVSALLGERRPVANAALAPQCVEQLLFDLEGGKLRKESRIGLWLARGIDRLGLVHDGVGCLLP